jgi:ribosomal protein L37AE/L43A
MRVQLCPKCKRHPIRREQECRTWLECPVCGLKGASVNLNASYAYLDSMIFWNAAAAAAESS